MRGPLEEVTKRSFRVSVSHRIEISKLHSQRCGKNAMKPHDSGLSPDMVPDTKVSVRETFGLDQDLECPAFRERTDVRAGHRSPLTVSIRKRRSSILAGFAFNRRVMIQGYHGTGKSTHIEQVAARLNWPCIRINLDSHISRIDLVGKDAIVVRDGQQVTEFKEGMSAVGTATPDGARIRRIRRRPARRDVRDPARARSRRQADAARSEQGHQPAPGVPAVLDDEHDRPRRYDRALSRHAADQPGPDGPLEHRDDAELPAARRRSRRSCSARSRRWQTPRRAPADLEHGVGRRSDAPRLHQRRPLGRDVAAYRDHVGRKRRDLQRRRLRVSRVVPEQVRRTGAADRRRVLPALYRRRSRRCDARHHAEGARSQAASKSP